MFAETYVKKILQKIIFHLPPSRKIMVRPYVARLDRRGAVGAGIGGLVSPLTLIFQVGVYCLRAIRCAPDRQHTHLFLTNGDA